MPGSVSLLSGVRHLRDDSSKIVTAGVTPSPMDKSGWRFRLTSDFLSFHAWIPMPADPFMNFVFAVVLFAGWAILIGLFIFFIRKAPKDGPDPGPMAKLPESEPAQED